MKSLPVITFLTFASALVLGGATQARPPALPPSGDFGIFNVFVVNHSDQNVVGGYYGLGKDASGTDVLTFDTTQTFDPSHDLYDPSQAPHSAIVGPGQSGETQIFLVVGNFNGGVYNVGLFGSLTPASAPGEAPLIVPLTVELDSDTACEGPGASFPSYCDGVGTLPDVTIPAVAPSVPSSVPEAGGLVPFGLGALGLGFLTLKAYRRKVA
jgi:hypothetical protein